MRRRPTHDDTLRTRRYRVRHRAVPERGGLHRSLPGFDPRRRLSPRFPRGARAGRPERRRHTQDSRRLRLPISDHPGPRESGRIASVALNLGIRAARGEILVRMDAHLVYPTNYIGDLVAALQQTGADNVGGVLMTLPANQTAMARAIAIGTSHPFGVGNAYFRIGIREQRWVDTVTLPRLVKIVIGRSDASAPAEIVVPLARTPL